MGLTRTRGQSTVFFFISSSFFGFFFIRFLVSEQLNSARFGSEPFFKCIIYYFLLWTTVCGIGTGCDPHDVDMPLNINQPKLLVQLMVILKNSPYTKFLRTVLIAVFTNVLRCALNTVFFQSIGKTAKKRNDEQPMFLHNFELSSRFKFFNSAIELFRSWSCYIILTNFSIFCFFIIFHSPIPLKSLELTNLQFSNKHTNQLIKAKSNAIFEFSRFQSSFNKELTIFIHSTSAWLSHLIIEFKSKLRK